MTVTFTVEDGTGVTGANSYVSLTEANDYFSVDVFSNWITVAPTDLAKKNVLMKATRLLDSYYDFEGCKTSTDQPLRWPRNGIYDLDDVMFESDEIPQPLKNAVCELAVALLSVDYGAEASDRGVTSIEVDVIKIVFDKGDRQGYLPPKVTTWMREIGTLKAGSRNIKLILS